MMAHTNFKDWPGMAAGLLPAIKELHRGSPGVMKGFREMAAAAHEGGALDAKTKELLAVAISVAVRCDPCITYHVKARASREQAVRKLPKHSGWRSIWARDRVRCTRRRRWKRSTSTPTRRLVRIIHA